MLQLDIGPGEGCTEVRGTVREGSIGLFVDASVSTSHREALTPIAAHCKLVFQEEELPIDEGDDVLLRHCGTNRYVFLTEDQHIRSNAYYVRVATEARIGFIEVRFRKASFKHKDEVYRRHIESLCELARHPVPFCVAVNHEGFRFVKLDSNR